MEENTPNYNVEKEDIDPSDYTEKELRDIIFHGAFCAKVVEELLGGEDEECLRRSHNVIRKVDGLPASRSPGGFHFYRDDL